VKSLFGRYLVRTDGKLLHEADVRPETTVLADDTGLPLDDVTGVQEGNRHGCAVRGTARTAWCWRTAADGNNDGQLGNGTVDMSGPVFRATPVLTAANQPLANVVAISDGEQQFDGASTACAVTTDGKLYCWGTVAWLVNGGSPYLPPDSPYAVPITVDGVTPLTGVLQVAISAANACAVVRGASSNDVWCWGQDFHWVLGHGQGVTVRYPTRLTGLANPIKIVMNGLTACALESSGGVRCWGSNLTGSTGTGTKGSADVVAPASVVDMAGSSLDGVVDLHGGEVEGYGVFCGLRTNHALQCWGVTFAEYASADGDANVFALGGAEGGRTSVRYVTGDGLYHIGRYFRAPNCGLLQ
jgi:hypothetical protein